MKKYYTDGSSTIGVKSAYVVFDEQGKYVDGLTTLAPNEFTNNEEEYRGVIKALELCQAGDIVFTDSLLVVNQIYGKYKVKKEHLKPLCQIAQELIQKNGASVIWIERENNLAGKFFE
jgi:ribonuclease HI